MIVHPDYYKKRAMIERRKQRLQKMIDDLESDAAILDHQIMQYNGRLDILRNRCRSRVTSHLGIS